MPRFVALLRAVNVGGKNKVPMAELRELGGAAGFENVRPLLQSGNVVFDAPDSPNAVLEAQWSAAILSTLGLSIDVVVRNGSEWRDAIAVNPVPIGPETNLSHLYAFFLKSEPAPEAIAGTPMTRAC